MRTMRPVCLLSILLLTACAGNRTPGQPAPVPLGSYQFNGTIGGQRVFGELLLLEGEVRILSDVGGCPEGGSSRTAHETSQAARLRRLEVGCGNLAFQLEWDEQGRLIQPVPTRAQLMVQGTQQGACTASTMVNGRSVCTSYQQIPATEPTWLTGAVVMRRKG